MPPVNLLKTGKLNLTGNQLPVKKRKTSKPGRIKTLQFLSL
jgi:hypothetical protein